MSSHNGLRCLFGGLNRSTKSLLSRFCPGVPTSLTARSKNASWRPFEPLEPRQLLSGSIAGAAFADANNNGQLDTGEVSRSGVVVYLDQNQNGSLDGGEASDTTDSGGQYGFGSLAAGTYYVRTVAQTGWAATLPASGVQSITLATDQNATQDLGHRYAHTIDNGQSGYSETGSGWISNTTGSPHGADARINPVGTGTDTATWAFTGLTPGYYRVLSTHGYHGNRSADAPYTVFDGSTSLGTVEVNQTVAPSEFSDAGRLWEDLGVFQIGGSTLSVTLTDGALYGDYISADAVRLVQVASAETPEVIDDGDLGYTQSGTWGLVSAGGYGGDGRYRSSTSGTASWTFSGLSAGYYRLEPTWSAHSQRALDVGYSVYDGTTNVANLSINQRVAPSYETALGRTWGNLGVFEATSGTLKLELTGSALGTGNFVADAVRLVPASGPDLPGVIDFGRIGYAESGSGWIFPGTPDPGFNGEYRLNTKGTGADKASWTYAGLEAGTYDVFVTWAVRADAATAAPFTVYDGATSEGTTSINQTVAPADQTALGSAWKLLGQYVIGNGSLKVEATDNFATGTYLVADAVRIVKVSSGVTADISGATSVAEGSLYTLNLATSGGGTPTQWNIDWGDGSDPDSDGVVGQIVSGSPSSVTHTYADGDANVTINATATIAGTGYADSLGVQVTNVAPTLTISVTGPTEVDEGAYSLSLGFVDPGEDTLIKWLVDWGDGSITELPLGTTVAAHNFDGDGDYIIQVIAFDEDSPTEGYTTAPISVNVDNVAPAVSIVNAPTTLPAHREVFLRGGVDDPSDADDAAGFAHAWAVTKDGSPYQLPANTLTTDTEFAFTPTSPGVYQVTLTVTDKDNATNTDTKTIAITSSTPVLVVKGDTTVNEGDAYVLDLRALYLGDDTVTQWSVDWGDGSAVEHPLVGSSIATHVYGQGSNTYTIEVNALTQNGPAGGYDAAPLTVSVAEVAPEVAAHGAGVVIEGQPYELGLFSFDPGTGDAVTSWTVNWGDGSGPQTYPGTSETVTHTYLEGSATHTITVSALSGGVNYNAQSPGVVVANVAPTATFELTTPGTINEGGSATFAFSNPQDSPGDTAAGFTYQFDLNGDGVLDASPSATPSANRVFADNGVYVVRGRIIDRDGAYRDYWTQVNLTNAGPTISASGAASVNQGSNYVVSFTYSDTSSDAAGKWIVDWGDGRTDMIAGNLSQASHVYLAAGTHAINVSLKDDDGTFTAAPISVSVQNQRPSVIPDGLRTTVYGNSTYLIPLKATDPGGDAIHHWTVNWGDGTPGSPNIETITGDPRFAQHTYADTGFNNIYTVTVTANDGAIDSLPSTFNLNVLANRSVPAIPTDLAATVVSATQINLTWTPDPRAEGYWLEQSTDGTNFTVLPQPLSTGGAYSLTNLMAGTQYHFRLRAFNTQVTAPVSGAVSASTTAIAPPAAPTNLRSTVDGSGYIRLDWDDPASDVYYVVEVKNGSEWTYATHSIHNTFVYSDADFYTYFGYPRNIYNSPTDQPAPWALNATVRVRAMKDNLVLSDPSNEITVSRGTSIPPVTNLTASLNAEGRIILNWDYDPSVQDLLGFQIRYVGEPIRRAGDLEQTASDWYPQATIHDPDLRSYDGLGSPYDLAKAFGIWKQSASGVHEFSVVAIATNHPQASADATTSITVPHPAAPSNLTAAAVVPNQIRLTWDVVTGYNRGYFIERADEIGNHFTVIAQIDNPLTTQWNDGAVSPSLRYTYRIRSYDGTYGYSSYTGPTAPMWPLPLSPNLAARIKGFDQIELNWADNSDNETQYELEVTPTGGSASTQTLPANGVQHLLTGLALGTYTFRLRATNPSGNSPWSIPVVQTIARPDISVVGVIGSDTTQPGTVLPVGEPYLGYDFDQSVGFNTDDSSPNQVLRAVNVTLPSWVNPAKATLTFEFDESSLDPAIAVPGLRLWRTNSAARSALDLIHTGQTLTVPQASGRVNNNFTLYVEGVAADADLGNRQIKVKVNPDGLSGSAIGEDTSYITSLDADIDSDNTSSGPPSGTQERIENDVSKPGKILVTNKVDRDGDGLPDFADGFSWNLSLTTDDAAVASMRFVPMVIRLPGSTNIAQAKLKLIYSGSDPAAVQLNSNGGLVPASGSLRIWTKNGSALRLKSSVAATTNPGDYVQPSAAFDASRLTWDTLDGELTTTLYIEAVAASQSVGQRTIQVDAALNGSSLFFKADSVVVTAIDAKVNEYDGAVRLGDGSAAYSSEELVSLGFGLPWGHERTWANAPEAIFDNVNGQGMFVDGWPRLIQGTSTVIALLGRDTIYFDFDGSGYAARYGRLERLVGGAGGHTLTDASGNRYLFNDFNENLPRSQRGAINQFKDAGGNVTSITYDAGGKVTTAARGTAQTGGVTSWHYTYKPVGDDNAGLIAEITFVNTQGSRTAYFTYYSKDEAANVAIDGNLGDLKLVVVKDGETVIETKHYRYHKKLAGETGPSRLKAVLEGDSWVRAAQVPGGPLQGDIAPYADLQLNYDNSNGRVEEQIVQGAGDSNVEDRNATGTFTYQYATNTTLAVGVNVWSFKTTQIQDGGPTRTVYTNYAGQVLLSEIRGSDGKVARTAYQYDARGRRVFTIHGSAITSILESRGNPAVFNASAGLVEEAVYVSEGFSAAGQVHELRVQKGFNGTRNGTSILTDLFAYTSQAVDGASVWLVEAHEAYRAENGTEAITTTHVYTDWNEFRPVAETVIVSQTGEPDVQTNRAYDGFGRLISLSDSVGSHTWEYDNDTGALKVEVIGGGGLSLTATTSTWDLLGRPKHVTDPFGLVTDYEYSDDATERSVTITPSLGPTVKTVELPGQRLLRLMKSTAFSLEPVRFEEQHVDNAGRTVKLVRMPGDETPDTTIEYAYDAGRLYQQMQYQESATPLKIRSETTFDGLGRPVAEARGGEASLVTWKTMQYDNGQSSGDGNLTQVTLIPGEGDPNRVATYFYDWRNRPVGYNQSNTQFGYYALDNVGQHRAEYVYDRLIASFDPANPPQDGLMAETRFAYDQLGHVTQTTAVDPGGAYADAVTTMTYDARGRLVRTESPTGLFTETEYDAADRVIRTSAGTDAQEAQSVEHQYTLTSGGGGGGGYRVLTTTRELQPDGTTYRVSYAGQWFDKAGRLTDAVDYGTYGTNPNDPNAPIELPAQAPASSNEFALVTHQEYDLAGRLLWVRDAEGIVTAFGYDNLGRKTQEIQNYGGSGAADDGPVTTTYRYNAHDQMTEINKFTSVVSLGITRYKYDQNGLTQVLYPGYSPASPDGGKARIDVYLPNNLGEAVLLHDHTGPTHVYSRDAMGRVVEDVASVGQEAVEAGVIDVEVLRRTYAYDALNRLTRATSHDGVGQPANQQVKNEVKRQYDAWGHVIAEFQAVDGAVDTNTTPHVQYLYGSDGLRLRQMVYPDGRCVWYGYDSELDEALARPTWIADAATGGDQVLESYQYLGLAMPLTRSRPLNDSASTLLVETIVPDAFGRIGGLAWAMASETLLSLGYAYDFNSNPVRRHDGKFEAYSESNRINQRNQQDVFTRGPAESPSLTQTWNYNRKGNLERSTLTQDIRKRPVLASAYSDMGELGNDLKDWALAHETGAPGQAMAASFDAWGNLTRLQEFTVRRVEDGELFLIPTRTLDLSFDYDALNRRIRERRTAGDTASDQTIYFDLQGNVLQENDTTQYVWSPASGNLILRDRDTDSSTPTLEERIYALDDGQGNVSAIADRNGQILQRYFYTPEGQLLITDENGRFTNNGQTWKAPSYDWRYLFRTGRQDASETYRIGGQEWDYTQGGVLGPDADAYWNHQLAIEAPSLSAYDRVVLTTVPVAIGATVTAATFGWGAPIGYALMAGSLALGYTNGASNRYLQGQSDREVFEGAAYDATGFTAVHGGLYNQDYMTGEDLGWSTGERWFHGIMGGVQLLGVLGAGVGGVSSGLSRLPSFTVPQPVLAVTTNGALAWTVAGRTVSLASLGRSGTGVLAGPGGLAGGLDSLSRFAQSSTSGNNKAAQTGVARHKTYYAPLKAGGYRVNEAISKTIRLRPDAWKIVLDSNRTPIGVILRELKPNVARSIARGWAQLDKYEAAIKRGYPWLKNVPFLKGVDTH